MRNAFEILMAVKQKPQMKRKSITKSLNNQKSTENKSDQVKVIKCEKCPKTYFTTDKELENHVKNFHLANKNLECKICGKKFTGKAQLFSHVRVHTRKYFSCDICGYKNFCLKDLKIHFETHISKLIF